MNKFPPLSRHTEKFTEETVNGLLGSEDLWYRRGSILYEAALRLVEGLDDQLTRSSLVVGKPVAAVIDHPRIARVSREIVPAMLYGMALECWMKGFLIAALPRASRQQREAIHQRLVELIPGDPPTSEIIGALAKSEFRAMLDAQATSEAEENEARRREIKKHKQHDLMRLSKDCGLDRYLKPHDREYLGFLSKAIMLGRYPSSYRPEDLFPWEGIACAPERWESLNDAVFEFHGTLHYPTIEDI